MLDLFRFQNPHYDYDEDDSSIAPSVYSAAPKKEDEEEIFGVSKEEKKAVRWSRFCFLCSLLVGACLLGFFVYRIVDDDEEESFQSAFDNLANEVLDLSTVMLAKDLTILKGVTTTITSFMLHEHVMMGHNHHTAIPGFTTLPNVEEHFSVARSSTGAATIAYMPLVKPEHLQAWKNYSIANQGWIGESNGGVDAWIPIAEEVFGVDEETGEFIVFDESDGLLAPIWTASPPPDPTQPSTINYNLLESSIYKNVIEVVNLVKKSTVSDVNDQGEWFSDLLTVNPVLASFEEGAEVVGHIAAVIPWSAIFDDFLNSANDPIMLVVENTCHNTVTFLIDGRDISLISESENVHDERYDNMYISVDLDDFTNTEELIELGVEDPCRFTVLVYPTKEMEDTHRTKSPVFYVLIVLGAFLIPSISFLVFDFLAQRRQQKVLDTAVKHDAIVSSMFPKSIQAKMFSDAEDTQQTTRLSTVGKAGVRNFLLDGSSRFTAIQPPIQTKTKAMDKSKPIADLFPETTIMFADIVGFTAWSSTREPSAVFTLLETIYHDFDAAAKKRRVFKVETIGDCYVAVCGLPDPRKDHAVVMARFATECQRKMRHLTNQLEVQLGPDTADLGLRIGLHSGPVVAGVLRGEKSRFQLFGDTMNTASRMESTCEPNKIQMSQITTDLLLNARKKSWIIPREDKIQAKGKGAMTTYWLDIEKRSNSDSRSVASSEMSVNSAAFSLDDFQIREYAESREKLNRIADWTVEILGCILKEIGARRLADPQFKAKKLNEKKLNKRKNGAIVIDEVEEIIMLPEFDSQAVAGLTEEPQVIPEVFRELKNYVRTVATLYHDNPFHNFAHANHVTMSVTKLLGRIVAPDIDQLGEDANNRTLHDHTYGITSDPLTRFAVVFSALIHDVDHTGVSNTQLIKEKPYAAKVYRSKSVAEQNSVDLAWDLLMEDSYKNLRRAIYQTEAEFKRFRQLVVNCVMATDIMDKDLKKLRNDRWDVAFALTSEEEKASRPAVNRKATIVIEHLIQASDVAHTMQHWHIYRKWNERLFREMYKAYKEGRMDTDPSENWYEGEIGFFDFYIIPLAKKLKDCGVFGVSSDEYLGYAQANRAEWEERGKEVVAEMLSNAKRQEVADHMYLAHQDNIDEEGKQIVDQMAESFRRMSIQGATRRLSLSDRMDNKQQQQQKRLSLPATEPSRPLSLSGGERRNEKLTRHNSFQSLESIQSAPSTSNHGSFSIPTEISAAVVFDHQKESSTSATSENASPVTGDFLEEFDESFNDFNDDYVVPLKDK